MSHKTLHRKLKIEQHEPHLKPGVKSEGRDEPNSFYIEIVADITWLKLT